MTEAQIAPDLTVEMVLEEWPETVSVFQELKTACVGCDMAPFDTLEDVARIYQLEIEYVIAALEARVRATGDGSSQTPGERRAQ